jgi:exonuclease SbcD
VTDWLRFVHSSDWHLDRPVGGLVEIPDHLRQLLIEAPYLAAQRVVETAISEKANFVVLAGDLLDLRRAGPAGAAFLDTQFERLHQCGIAVYWASGLADPVGKWPRTVPLPANVRRFGRPQAEEVYFERDGARTRIVGLARIHKEPSPLDDFHSREGMVTIGVAHGPFRPGDLHARHLDYWALGGGHQRRTLFSDRGVAHYCGSPQGRREAEAGVHGCTLVEVDAQRRVQTRLVSTDVVRFCNEEIRLEAGQGPAELQRALDHRLTTLSAEAPDTDLVIRWRVVCDDRRGIAIVRRQADELIEELRTRHGYETPVRWSTAMEIKAPPAEGPPGQDSLLADFLRELREFEADARSQLGLEELISQRRRGGAVSALVALDEPRTRRSVVEEVARLAEELLGAPSQGTRS